MLLVQSAVQLFALAVDEVLVIESLSAWRAEPAAHSDRFAEPARRACSWETANASPSLTLVVPYPFSNGWRSIQVDCPMLHGAAAFSCNRFARVPSSTLCGNLWLTPRFRA
jgi:hypothetical protein